MVVGILEAILKGIGFPNLALPQTHLENLFKVGFFNYYSSWKWFSKGGVLGSTLLQDFRAEFYKHKGLRIKVDEAYKVF